MRLFALSMLMLAGCHAGPPPSFYWDNGSLIGSAPDLSTGIAAGSHAMLKFAAGGVADVESSNAEAATFELDTGEVFVTAHAPGNADLILRDAQGAEVDRGTVRVAPTVELVVDVMNPEAVRVLEDATTTFHVATLGPGGEDTVGTGAVSFSAGGTAVQEDRSIWDYGDTMRFHGSAGAGRLTATADSASASLDVEFVPLASLTQVTSTAENLGSGQIDVSFTSSSSAGPVYGVVPQCTPSDASVEFGSVGANPLAAPAVTVRRFSLTKRGSFTADCAVGSLHTMVHLSY